MAMTEDLSAFFNTNEHAIAATFEGGTVNGHFQDLYLEAFEGEDGVGVSTSRPEFECVEADVPNPIGKNLTIGTDIYLIEEARPDGEGITTLILQVTTAVETFRYLWESADTRLWESGDHYRWES